MRKLPFREPDRLVMVWEKNPTLGAVIGERIPTAYVNFQEWVRQQHVFESIAALEDVSLTRTAPGEPERVAGARVSPNFFSVLGVTPEVGSSFDFVEHDPSQSHAAILGYAYWKEPFRHQPGGAGTDPDAERYPLHCGRCSLRRASICPRRARVPNNASPTSGFLTSPRTSGRKPT